ncbi:nucleoside recognition domain-containing protein [Caldicellulosiruptoraceae bacterium PP1]
MIIFFYQLPAMFILIILLYSIFKRNNVFKSFVEGIKQGLYVVLNILPNLFALVFVVELFVRTKASDFFINFLKPLSFLFGIPEKVLPLIIIRPLSGSGALSYVNSIFERFGADSKEGIFASVICTSSETLFYVIATYIGATKIKNTRYLIWVALLVEFFLIIITSIILNIFFINR